MDMGKGPLKGTPVRANPSAELLSGLVQVQLPRGLMDIRLRVAMYADGSRALELQDPEGKPFYWPTLPACPATILTLLPPDDLDSVIVAIKPSALKNGMASALEDARLITDLGIEMPVDRHWVRLMRLELEAFAQCPEAQAVLLPQENLDLKEAKIPPGWEATALRIQQAFRQQGFSISAEDACESWARHWRKLAYAPPGLPPSTGEICHMLRRHFQSTDGGQ